VIGAALGVGVALVLALALRSGDEDPDRGSASEPGAAVVVATFRRGQITLADVVREVRSLAPGLKHGTPPFLQRVAVGLVMRRALSEEAKAAGIAVPRGAWRDRRLVRALLEKEGLRPPRNHVEAREHLRRFAVLALRASGDVQVKSELLTEIPGDVFGPVEPVPGAVKLGRREPFFLSSPEGGDFACDGEIAGGWYQGMCEGFDTLLDALGPEHVVYLEATYGPVEGFLHRFAYDGRARPKIQISHGHADTALAMPPPIPADAYEAFVAELTSVEVTGAVDPAVARRAFERVEGAFRHCAAYYHWNNEYREEEGTLRVRLALTTGVITGAEVETDGLTRPIPILGTMRLSGFSAGDCVHPLRTYGVAGTGEVRFTLHVKGRSAPAAPSAMRVDFESQSPRP
jgi:hypothetical protein